jgi:hypothetical protein
VIANGVDSSDDEELVSSFVEQGTASGARLKDLLTGKSFRYDSKEVRFNPFHATSCMHTFHHAGYDGDAAFMIHRMMVFLPSLSAQIFFLSTALTLTEKWDTSSRRTHGRNG